MIPGNANDQKDDGFLPNSFDPRKKIHEEKFVKESQFIDYKSVFVKKLPFELTEFDVIEIFMKAGVIHKIRHPPRRCPLFRTRFAFIQFADARAADRAIRLFNGFRIGKSRETLVVQPYRSAPPGQRQDDEVIDQSPVLLTNDESSTEVATKTPAIELRSETKSAEAIAEQFAGVSVLNTNKKCVGPAENQKKIGDGFCGLGPEESPKRKEVRKLYKYENGHVVQNEIVDENHAGIIRPIGRKKCSFCAKECKSKCQCKKAFYCNLKCQEADFERHRTECAIPLANQPKKSIATADERS